MDDTIILGVDPGLGTTGYGVVRVKGSRVSVVEAGTVRTSEQEYLEKRLSIIHRAILDIIDETHPQMVVVEDLYSKYEHPRTAILMGHVRGVICLAAGLRGVELQKYAATRVKNSIAGTGRASKEQVQRMVQQRLGLLDLPRPNDVADALALALCHANECVKSGWTSSRDGRNGKKRPAILDLIAEVKRQTRSKERGNPPLIFDKRGFMQREGLK